MFKKINNYFSLSVYLRLLHSLQPYLVLFLIGMIATLFESLSDAGFVWLIKPTIDRGFIAKDQEFIHWLPFIIIFIFLFKGILSFVSNYFVNQVGRRIITDYRQRVFYHLLRLPASFYDSKSSGQLLSLLIYNVEQVAEATTFALLTLVQEGFLAIGFLFVMFANSWQLSCIFLVTTPLMAYIFRYTSKRLQMLSTNVQKAVGNVSHVAEETIEGYKVVRTFGGEQYEEAKFKKATEQNQKREMKIIVTDTVGSSSVQLLAAIPISISLYLATLPSLHISAGSFAAILGAMVSVLRPVRRMSKVNTMIQRGIAGARSLFELFDEPLENDNGQVKLKRAKGEIVYEHVTFHYPSNAKRIILKDVNFTIRPGETVALVGHSGSGKTSLVNLLARFYDVQRGNILVDGLDIRQYRLRDLRNQFAFVSQHVSLFNDTIAQNISYGRFNKVDMTEIEKVAKAAYAYDFIRQLPNGFHTLIGENGVLLSGGQRQRIAIARALLKDAPILILDEATSALDTESERYIQAALEQLMQNRTTIVIAHRLSTIEKADRILLLEQGIIKEAGTHLELLALGGRYAKLHAMQFHRASETPIYEMT